MQEHNVMPSEPLVSITKFASAVDGLSDYLSRNRKSFNKECEVLHFRSTMDTKNDSTS